MTMENDITECITEWNRLLAGKTIHHVEARGLGVNIVTQDYWEATHDSKSDPTNEASTT